jgi:peptide deformylase
LVNPEIVHREGKILWEEGCLSIPQVYEKIERSKQVTVRAQDENGETFEIEADELLAVALQHEIDHLDGVLFFDRMSQLKRTRALKKYKKVMENRALEAEEAQAEGDAS